MITGGSSRAEDQAALKIIAVTAVTVICSNGCRDDRHFL